MRYRNNVVTEKVGHSLIENHIWDDYNSSSSDNILLDSDFVEKEHIKEMWDIVTPNFNRLKCSGIIVNSPMTSVNHILVDKPATVYYCGKGKTRYGASPNYYWRESGSRYQGSTGVGLTGIFNTYGHLAAPDVSKEDYEALTLNKAWSNVSLSEIQTLASLGESRETVESIVSVFVRLIRILKSIRNAEFLALIKTIKPRDLADAYMEARYAMRPLYYEVAGYAAAFTTKTGTIRDRLTFRGHETNSEHVSDTITVVTGNYHGAERRIIVERETSVSLDVRSGVLTQLETDSQLPAWGLTEVLESAWELVPYSFVVDWFLNVGNTIAAFTPDYGLRALASWTVATTTVAKTFRIWGSSADFPLTTSTFQPLEHTYFMNGGELNDITVTKERIPNPSRSLLPRCKLRLSTAKLLDLLIIAKNLR